MWTDLHREHQSAVRDAFANGLGGDVVTFDSEQLVIVDRPESTWPYTAMVVTFGTGTLISVDPSFRDVVLRNQPERHYAALYAGFLNRIVDEGKQRGMHLAFSSPAIGWALVEAPAVPPVPDGYELQTRDAEWMNAEQGNLVFTNGVGESAADGREFRNRFARILVDGDGEIVAVAGAFDTYGLLEIGIDVVRSHRGRGLAPLMVRAAASAILKAGKTPFYGCAATNIRSQRTALAAGFMPVCSDVVVAPYRP